MWFNWIIDFGNPGPDRGAGGRFLVLPPGYDGPVPEGGFYVARSATSRVLILGRSFIKNDDPKPTADEIERTLKIYPYSRRRTGHEHRRDPHRHGEAGAPGGGAADGIRRGHRQGDEHHPAQRLRLL